MPRKKTQQNTEEPVTLSDIRDWLSDTLFKKGNTKPQPPTPPIPEMPQPQPQPSPPIPETSEERIEFWQRQQNRFARQEKVFEG